MGSVICIQGCGRVFRDSETAGAWKRYVGGPPDKSERANTLEIFYVCKIEE